jgi:hypothetical protein
MLTLDAVKRRIKFWITESSNSFYTACIQSVEFGSMSDKYRIKSPTIALFPENGRHVTRTVPEGAIVEIKNLSLDGKKLVEVLWVGRNVLMFSQDIQSRGERVQER